MTTTCAVTWCGRPVEDAWTCAECGRQLADDLAAVPGLAAELDTMRARQGRFTEQVGAVGSGRGEQLPYDERATEAGYILRSTLVGWVRLVAENLLKLPVRHSDGITDHPPAWSLPEDSMASMARWLLYFVERLRHHEAGHEAVEEFHAAVSEVRRAIDRPPDRWYAGPCACGVDLYAHSGNPTVQCRACGTGYEVEKLRARLLEAVEDTLATGPEISRAVTTLGHPVTPDAIRGYVRRGRLVARARDLDGRRLYRVGDVLDIVSRTGAA